ncbi:MAG: dCTP deaminase [Clostridia bacterium]|nr:dCTP deaminase [Clostridia bacterium]
MLTKSAIMEEMRKGNIIIQPFNQKQLNPNSYNVTLNERLERYTCDVLDAYKENPTEEIIIPKEGYVLEPNVLYLARTNEYTETYNLVPGIDGRSSIGRLGIEIHRTAGFGDVGFRGTWTLEITAVMKVRVYPNMQIGQLYYEEITGEPTNYEGRYQDQIDATPCRLYKDFEQEK